MLILNKNKKTAVKKNTVNRNGIINFFDPVKNYGSVRDSVSRENYIFYGQPLNFVPATSNYISYEIDHTPEGMLATNVMLVPR